MKKRINECDCGCGSVGKCDQESGHILSSKLYCLPNPTNSSHNPAGKYRLDLK